MTSHYHSHLPSAWRNRSGLKTLGSLKLAGSLIIAAMLRTNKEPAGKEKSPIRVEDNVLCCKEAGATIECLWTSAITACDDNLDNHTYICMICIRTFMGFVWFVWFVFTLLYDLYDMYLYICMIWKKKTRRWNHCNQFWTQTHFLILIN